MSKEDYYIDEETVKVIDELVNPKKYHWEVHSDDTIHFYKKGEELDYDEVVGLLNQQDNRINKLDCEYSMVSNVLNDFIDINNRLQADPQDEKLICMLRDMLLMMGVDLE